MAWTPQATVLGGRRGRQTKRLFGARGGAKAHHAALHSVSLLEVEVAAVSEQIGRGSRRSRSQTG